MWPVKIFSLDFTLLHKRSLTIAHHYRKVTGKTHSRLGVYRRKRHSNNRYNNNNNNNNLQDSRHRLVALMGRVRKIVEKDY